MPVLENTKHELFANYIVLGDSKATAYRKAGYETTSEQSASSAGSRLLSYVSVKERIAELKEATAKRTRFTRDKLGEFYEDIIESKRERTGDRLKAGDQLSKLLGWDSPIKSEVLNTHLLVDSALLSRLQSTYSAELIPLLNPETRQLTSE